jgi:hypothetical protein
MSEPRAEVLVFGSQFSAVSCHSEGDVKDDVCRRFGHCPASPLVAADAGVAKLQQALPTCKISR